jgi:hypothetical protein
MWRLRGMYDLDLGANLRAERIELDVQVGDEYQTFQNLVGMSMRLASRR